MILSWVQFFTLWDFVGIIWVKRQNGVQSGTDCIILTIFESDCVEGSIFMVQRRGRKSLYIFLFLWKNACVLQTYERVSSDFLGLYFLLQCNTLGFVAMVGTSILKCQGVNLYKGKSWELFLLGRHFPSWNLNLIRPQFKHLIFKQLFFNLLKNSFTPFPHIGRHFYLFSLKL